MAEDTAQHKAEEGVTRLLLGPVFLVHEIASALIPGTLFCILLLAKGNRVALSAFHAEFLGYRTKLLLGLLVCYVIGKAFELPLAMVEARLMRSSLPEAYRQSGRITEQNVVTTVLGGAILLPGWISRTRGLDYLIAMHAGIAFYLSTGLVLVVASALPGDGYLRLIELGIGLPMMCAGFYRARTFIVAVVAFVGVSLTDLLERLPAPTMAVLLQVGRQLLSAQKTDKPPGPSASG